MDKLRVLCDLCGKNVRIVYFAAAQRAQPIQIGDDQAESRSTWTTRT